jgi:hypothetical protein
MTFPLSFRRLSIIILCATAPAAAIAQISLTSTTYSENFDSMGSTGTTTPTGWTVDLTANTAATGTSTDAPVNTGTVVGSSATVVAGTGSLTTGGNYNFGVAGANPVTDRALGSLASANNQRDTYVSFTNNTGFSIVQFTLTYDGEQWRLGANPSAINIFTLQYSATGASGSWVDLGNAFNFTSPITSGTVGALDGNAAANRVSGIGSTYTPSSQIANGSSFYLRWADPDDGGSDNALAIDNVNISFTTVVPEPSAWILLTAGLVILGFTQRRRLAKSQKS